MDQSYTRLVLVFDGRWKYEHVEKMRPMLFDLENDPCELYDLGENLEYSAQIKRMEEFHFEWCRKHHSRVERSVSQEDTMTDAKESSVILIGFLDELELEAEGLSLPNHAKG